MQKIVECNLIVNSEINGEKDNIIVGGKGYYKEENNVITIYFADKEMKYKYIYENKSLKIYCNDSCYVFRENTKDFGEIKNGEFSLKITTFASKIQIIANSILLDYTLCQENNVLGKYNTILSFK